MHLLIKRLRYLRSREALASGALPAVIVWSWWYKEVDVAWSMRLAALSLVVYILVQGTLYWHLKLRTIEGHTALPQYFHHLFRAFKWSNLIGIGAVLLILVLPASAGMSKADVWWCVGLLIGAVLEHINYYYYQLMYDTRASFEYVLRNRQLRKSALAVDLARSGAQVTGAGSACS